MRANKRSAFTLVEILTVMAIIGLLIGILVPSLQAARDAAQRAATLKQINALASAAETFQGEFDRYPRSHGLNPFENESSRTFLSGAQWLAMELVGPDRQGFVKSDSLGSDSNDDGVIDDEDWLDWYDLQSSRTYSRFGPYVQPDGKILSTPESYALDNSQADQDVPYLLLSNVGGSDWDNSKIPFFVDGFGYPILYYRANRVNESNKPPFTTGSQFGKLEIGSFDQSDNAAFTGSEGTDGLYAFSSPGWDLTGSGFEHSMRILGYDSSDPFVWPAADTFAAAVSDRARFESTLRGNGASAEGKVAPHNNDTFIMISPGKDGLYGTQDDLRNFRGAGE